MIKLAKIPGYIDLPEAVFNAEGFAMGLNFQRLLDNAKFAVVRPEFFYKNYAHGDTVELPTSPVDGYTYERDELIYIWHHSFTGSPDDGMASGPGTVWYYGGKVNQLTGQVSSYVKYREREGTNRQMTNDGVLGVLTIAQRRRAGLSMAGGPYGRFDDVINAIFMVDKAVAQDAAQAALRAAKAAVVGTEAFYMGEFTNGQQVPRPVSPVDGYQYGYAECRFLFGWRWTCAGAGFGDPQTNQMQYLGASIDANGVVGTNVMYDGDPNVNTNDGRLAVVALCNRAGIALSKAADTFSDLADSAFAPGQAPRVDVMQGLLELVRFARMRVEFFYGQYHNGDTVALPVSPVDGYQYQRQELTYFCEHLRTYPQTVVRIRSFHAEVDQQTGHVYLNQIRMANGGDLKWTNDGTAHVWIIARRGHVQEAVADPGLLQQGSGTGGDVATLANASLRSWSQNGQQVADGWTVIRQDAGTYGYKSTAADGSANGQGAHVPAGAVWGMRSSRVPVAQGDRRYVSLRAIAAGNINAGGLVLRVRMLNNDLSNEATFDIVWAMTPAPLYQWNSYSFGFEIPRKNAAQALTSQGYRGIAGVYDFEVAHITFDLYLYGPSADCDFGLADVQTGVQADIVAGSIAQRGALALAFFPSIPFQVTDTTCDWTLPASLQFNDGRVVYPANGGAVHDSGLAPGARYAVYLWYDEVTNTIRWSGSGAGTAHMAWDAGWLAANPQQARANAMQQNAPNVVPLSDGPIYFTTNATAGPPTGGSGGGDSGCPREGRAFVHEFTRGIIRAEELNPEGGEFLWREGGWTETEKVDLAPADEWVVVDFTNGAKGVEVTAGGVFSDDSGNPVRAHDLTVRTEVPCPSGRTAPTRIEYKRELGRRVAIRCKEPHTYFISPDGAHWVLYHNMGRISTL